MGPAMGALEFDGAAGSPGAFGDSKRSLVVRQIVLYKSYLGARAAEKKNRTE